MSLALIPPMVGTELASRYRIEGPLGEGGMGRVYAAVDQQLGRRVAIKVIRDDLEDPAARKRFFREARAAAALSHPHACQLYEISGEDETQPFLVMELLEGEALSARLERGPMTADESIAVLLPLMGALGALHRAGLVHRDLKPANVFLTAQGVKLLDFGLARRSQRHDTMTMTALTVPGAVTGTMRHMAPEQITGDPIDARTDIFALGVMLFEMLTGRPPFAAESNAEWLRALLEHDPPSLGAPELRALDPIVARALQRRPADRYETVEQMAAELSAAGGAPDDAPAAAPPSTDARGAAEWRMVVLPFRLLQDDEQLAVLRDGVPEALTALLAARPGVTMVSNRVAQEFSDAADLVAAGRALRVDRLLTGSVLRGGDDLRVTVQLVNAGDGAVLWSQTYPHVVDNVLALQDRICAQVVEELPLGDAAAVVSS